MATLSIDQQIQARVVSFVEELTALVKQSALESVQTAFGATSAPRRGPGRPRGSAAAPAPRARAGGGGKRSSEQIDSVATRMLAHIRTHPGQGAEQIGKALKLTTKDMRLPITKLLGEKKVRTAGERRGTKYFVR